MDLNYFVQNLAADLGDQLLAVVLYGSSASGDTEKGYSDKNLILVVKDVTAPVLTRANRLLRHWAKHNPPPLFFDPAHMAHSLDVFPMEFLDIQTHHQNLYGADPFVNLKVDLKHLRHQCESELKGSVLQLTSRYAAVVHQPKEVVQLATAALSPLFAIFRGILRWKGITPLARKREVLEQLRTLVDTPLAVLDRWLGVREGREPAPRGKEVEEWFEQTLTALRAIIKYVDHS